MVRPLDNEAIIEAILDEGVGIVETSGHKAPEEYVDRLKRHGIRMIHKCVGVRYAQKAEALGVDAVTVVGYENGGATGRLDIATMVLVPAVVDAVKIPVIGGGGVADGRGFLAVLSLGAEGVILGTRLLVTRECPIHPLLKKALVSASEQDTMLVMRSIQATHRVWINEAARKTARMEAEGADLPALLTVIGGENTRRMIDGGDLDAGIISCGQAIGLVREELGIQDLMDRIITQAEAIHVRLAPAA
jgi:nitronate monooxygenase